MREVWVVELWSPTYRKEGETRMNGFIAFHCSEDEAYRAKAQSGRLMAGCEWRVVRYVPEPDSPE